MPQQPEEETDERTGRSAAAERMRNQAQWVDLQVRQAVERGDFDDLPGAGRPLKLPDRHDPDWWVKQLVEREKISGIAPPAIGLRVEDAELDAVLDRETTPEAVRRMVDDFNGRVIEARRQLTGGPPVVAAPSPVVRDGKQVLRQKNLLCVTDYPLWGDAQPSCMGIRTPRSAATSAADS